MPDISMCDGRKCLIKNTCYRFRAIPNTYQSFMDFKYDKHAKSCDGFLELRTGDFLHKVKK